MMTGRVYGALTQSVPGSNQFINGPLLTIFLKIPSILSDLIVGYLLYRVICTLKDKTSALLSASIFLFHPGVLYNSALWGQMDSLVVLPLIISLLFFVKDKPLYSWLFFLLSLYIKLTYVYLLPVIFLLSIKKFGAVSSLKYLTIGILIFIFTTISISTNPAMWLVTFIRDSAGGEMQEITIFAWNFWWMVFRPQIVMGSLKEGLYAFSEITLHNSPQSFLPLFYIPLLYWGFFLFGMSILPFLYMLTRLKKLTMIHLIILMTLSCLMAFTFIPRMHERYIYGVFPFIIMMAIFSKKYVIPLVIFTIINSLNLYAVWHPFVINLLVPLITSVTIQWYMSVLFVLYAFYTYILLLRDFRKIKI